MVDFIRQFVADFWSTLAEMSPYLILGFLVAGILSVWISPKLVERHLGGRGLLPILKASAFGIPLPLCSCGVIPVSMSLRQHGASKGATIAFLLSTPQTGVDSILVTYSLLGPIFMIVRPIVALITGLIGGLLVDVFDHTSPAPKPPTPEPTRAPCCSGCHTPPAWLRALRYGFISLPADIGKAMLIGLIIAAVISAAVPEDFFAPLLGGGILAMFAMGLIGIPMYVCATASVPIAVALIAKGVSPGAAMVFLMTGPATNAAAFLTLWTQLGRKSAILYILTVVVCALTSGLAIDQVFPNLGKQVTAHFCEMPTTILGHLSAIVLLTLLIWPVFFRRGPKP